MLYSRVMADATPLLPILSQGAGIAADASNTAPVICPFAAPHWRRIANMAVCLVVTSATMLFSFGNAYYAPAQPARLRAMGIAIVELNDHLEAGQIVIGCFLVLMLATAVYLAFPPLQKKMRPAPDVWPVAHTVYTAM